MLPWEALDRAQLPDGGMLTLHRRGEEYVIRVDGQDLMGSRMHGSEELLAQKGCAHLTQVRGARVLIGGLGMGFTLRAALDVLPADAVVDVVELVPAVVRWNRGPLAHLAGGPLDDARVRVHEADVAHVLAAPASRYHVVLLDVDNGPAGLTSPSNEGLYGEGGLARAASALERGGLLAVWSAADDPRFTARLRRAGFDPRIERVRARGHAGPRHVLWFAQRR
jgi:spermidine synthase